MTEHEDVLRELRKISDALLYISIVVSIGLLAVIVSTIP
jgi:hypothetical protein